ncbi:major facilitator superfamily domain-containing protein [Colletotrichum godetiae]|uniref:Major facilitator superfamily domain-containing protein n=1 Tax=Colletotrichum godetiae TaxID=1209918 RepID=A0AAJ0EZQ5_9PEZI|nr:major facilitator superfamily domain-containing protein [Colletotrichum godetiae]KAK1687763.1 major facilitator superfamily domain-containing protein [Colletotrichum godetiae]
MGESTSGARYSSGSASRLLLLTFPSLGLQVCWFLLTSSGTPYLISLGIPKSIISLVWVTGPISGAFAQPILGVLSDESQYTWGRRKPFIVGGSLCATIFLLALAHSEELTAWTWSFSSDVSDNSAHLPTQVLAVFCVIVTTFALQTYAVGVRALIVDNSPPSQQTVAASWAMRWNVLGNVVLSSIGFVDAQWSLTGANSNARFKILALAVAACTFTTVSLTCYFITDQDATTPRGRQVSFARRSWSIISPTGLAKRWNKIPPRSRRVCEIQFWAWAGWFPVLYYMSTQRQLRHPDRELVESAKDFGFFASFAFALGSFAASVLLQLLDHVMPAFSRNLPRVWLASQCFLGYCMHLTFVTRNGATAIIVVAMMGATAAVTMWAPFALISAEISELSVGKQDSEVAWILGLHNMAISLPQIGSTLLCAVLLAVLKGLAVQDSVAWIFRLASIAVFWSAYLIYKPQ